MEPRSFERGNDHAAKKNRNAGHLQNFTCERPHLADHQPALQPDGEGRPHSLLRQ
jgi:hypothetical protein